MKICLNNRLKVCLLGMALAGEFAAAPVFAQDAAKPETATTSPSDQDARVAKLIEQLGAGEFAARETAQAELAKIGLEAFDALNDASANALREIAAEFRREADR